MSSIFNTTVKKADKKVVKLAVKIAVNLGSFLQFQAYIFLGHDGCL